MAITTTIVVVCIALAASVHGSSLQAPEGWRCPALNGLYPVPGNCQMFAVCQAGTPTLGSCPEGLEFNPTKQACDYVGSGGSKCDNPENPPECCGGSVLTDFQCPGCECCLIPHPQNCSNFIRCQDGQAFEQTCSAGLNFNPLLGNCDFSWNSPCLSATSPPPDPTPPGFVCPEDTGTFPHPTDCGFYITCSNGFPIVQPCPFGLHFSAQMGICDYPENANCVPGTVPPRPPTVPTQPPPTTKAPPTIPPGWVCQLPGAAFPFPDECGFFIQCTNGLPIVVPCPAGLLFNPLLRTCDWPEHAGCGDGGNPNVYPNFKCDAEDGIYAHPDDCHFFIKCINSVPVVISCPGNLFFNPDLLICERPELVPGCNGGEIGVLPNYTCPAIGGMFPHPDNCHWFIHCSNGIAYIKECPANLEFNPLLLVCDWPENANCELGVTPPPSTPAPPVNNVTCPDPTCSCRFPNPSDCGSYYQCEGGVPSIKECPEGLYFNPTSETCDLPDNVVCEIVVPPPPGWECPFPDGFFPDPLDCEWFYHCANDIPYHRQCPAQLHFNPTTHDCDWPESAGCTKGATTVKPPSTTTTTSPPPTTPGDYECPDLSCHCRFPNPDSCEEYYQCDYGVAEIKMCPPGLQFNPISKVCDLAENAGCHESSVNCTKPDGTFPDTEDCSSYYLCSNGILHHQHCSEGLHYNAETGECDWSQNAGCEGSLPTPTPTLQPPPTNNITCPDDTCWCYFPDPEDCGSFYHCRYGIPYHKDCPEGLYFNSITRVCDYPQTSHCMATVPVAMRSSWLLNPRIGDEEHF